MADELKPPDVELGLFQAPDECFPENTYYQTNRLYLVLSLHVKCEVFNGLLYFTRLSLRVIVKEFNLLKLQWRAYLLCGISFKKRFLLTCMCLILDILDMHCIASLRITALIVLLFAHSIYNCLWVYCSVSKFGIYALRNY